MILKKPFPQALTLITLLFITNIFSAASTHAHENCIGESKEGNSHYEPMGPGNSLREIKTAYVNSCEAKTLHDEIESGKSGDDLIAAIAAASGQTGGIFAAGYIASSRADAAVWTSSIRDASNDFSHGIIITTEGGQFGNVRPQ